MKKDEDKVEDVVQQGATEEQKAETQNSATQHNQDAAATVVVQPANATASRPLSEQKEEAESATAPLSARQLRYQREADEAQNSYDRLREHYDNPSDSQIDAAIGRNMYAFQRQNNKRGNWGTAFGAGALFGRVNADTHKILEENYQRRKAAKQQEEAALKDRNRVLAVLKDSDGNDVNVTQGLKHDMEIWGQSVSDVNNLTPQEVATFKQILRRNGVIKDDATPAGTTATSQEEAGATQSLVSLLNGMPNADTLDDIFDAVGFYAEDGSLRLPHKETYEEMLARRQLEKEQIDYQTQQRELQRRNNRLGLADLAAGFGDMIKASNGAVVTKREFDNMYNQLTEQQKRNFDTYMARMQKLKDDAKAAADKDRQYAVRKEERKEDKDFQREMNDKQYNQQLSLLLAKAAADTAADAKKYNTTLEAEKIKQDAKNGNIVYGGKKYSIREGDSIPLYNALFGIMKEEIRKDEDLWGAFTALDKVGATVDKQQTATILALAALNNPTIQNSLSDKKKELISYILQNTASDVKVLGDVPVEPIVPVQGNGYEPDGYEPNGYEPNGKL